MRNPCAQWIAEGGDDRRLEQAIAPPQHKAGSADIAAGFELEHGQVELGVGANDPGGNYLLAEFPAVEDQSDRRGGRLEVGDTSRP